MHNVKEMLNDSIASFFETLEDTFFTTHSDAECLDGIASLYETLRDACFATHSDAERLAVPQAKQTAMEELTQGQAMTMVRNQQIIDKSAEEMDDLEEMLNESIADSMRSAKEKAAGQSGKKKKRYAIPHCPGC